MQIPLDMTTILQSLGSYSYNPSTQAEMAGKLQTMSGSAVDKVCVGIEILYAFRDHLGSDGMTLLGQMSGFASTHGWVIPGEPNRLTGIYQGVCRDTGEAGTWPLVTDDPEPNVSYRSDGINWKDAGATSLDVLKAAKWNAVKDQRALRENATCSVPLPNNATGVVQCDPKSKGNIDGLVTMALVANNQNAAYSEVFTLADNSTVTLDATGMINLGVAVGKYVAAVYANARSLRDQINAAADETALSAIDITVGWPAES